MKTVLDDAVEKVRTQRKAQLTVRLDKRALARLQKLAMREGTTLNRLAAAILESHLDSQVS